MLALAALLLHAAPPLPPPSQDRYEAGVRLWQDLAPSERERANAIDNAISHTVRAALVQGGIHVGHRRWHEKYDLLMERLRSRVPARRASIESRITDCAAQDLGHRLAAEDLDAARRFMATPEGARVRVAFRIAEDVLAHCYNRGVSDNIPLTYEDYRAARLRQPRYVYGILS